MENEVAKKHPHYHKDVSNLQTIDVYRVLKLFNVTDPCIQHAIKKLLVAGGRGAGKSIEKDLREAKDSISRSLQMIAEDDSDASSIPLSVSAQAHKDALTLGAGYIRVNADGSADLLDPTSLRFNHETS